MIVLKLFVLVLSLIAIVIVISLKIYKILEIFFLREKFLMSLTYLKNFQKLY